MADGRKRSKAKRARRSARRRQSRLSESPEEVPLIDEVREALDGGQPMDLLGLVSILILSTAPHHLNLPSAPDEEEHASLDELVAAFIDVQIPETTALLATLAEVLVGQDMLRARCRHEVDARDDSMPQWLTNLAHTNVHRAVRMTHVLGDGDELLLGVRLADGQELTCAVYVDHLMTSEVADAFFVPETIDAVLTVAKASNTDPDTRFDDLMLADARACIQHALEQVLSILPMEESDTWPTCRPLVQWLVQKMPEGGSNCLSPQHDPSQATDICDKFFASLVGMPFDDFDHRELLEMCIEEGTGDPLRWSAERLKQLLNAAVSEDNDIPVEVQLDAPELLRAFVPFAHAQSGIRQELTAEALGAIDERAELYRAVVLEEQEYWDHDEDPV